MMLVCLYLYGSLLSGIPKGSHEGDYVYTRLHQYVQELGEGIIPPMLFADAVNGAGSAFPLFYPPVSHGVGVLLFLLTGSYVAAMNLVFFVAVLASCLAMYALGWRLTGRRSMAMAMAVAYVTFPYRFSLVYARGAHAEAFTMAWLPLIALGVWHLIRSGRLRWYLPVSIALLALSHAVMTLYVGLALVMATPLVMLRLGWRGLPAYVGSAVLAVMLAAFYLLPMRYYLPDTRLADRNLIGATPASADIHRVDPGQFFFSDYFRWYGGSAGLHESDLMSFELGLVHLLMLALLVASLPGWWKRRRWSLHYHTGLACFAAWVFCIVLMIAPSSILRHLPEDFAMIQFPWRLLGHAGFLACLCLGLFGMFVPGLRSRREVWWIVTLMLVLAVPWFYRVPMPKNEWRNEDISSEFLRDRVDTFAGFTSFAEYHPASFPQEYLQNQKRPDPLSIDGSGIVRHWERSGHLHLAHVRAEKPGTAVVPITWYRFWRVERDGVEIEAAPHLGWISFSYPAGESTYRISRSVPWITRVGLTITALGCVLLPFFVAAANCLLRPVRRLWKVPTP